MRPITTETTMAQASVSSASLMVNSRPDRKKPRLSRSSAIGASLGAERALQHPLGTPHSPRQAEHQAEIDAADGGEHLECAEVERKLVHGDEGELRQSDCLQVSRVLQHRNRGV